VLVETQGSQEETMEIDETKLAQKRSALWTSSEEGGAVDEEGFITPKNKRSAKKNKGELQSDVMVRNPDR
jgi:hypothetical protein